MEHFLHNLWHVLGPNQNTAGVEGWLASLVDAAFLLAVLLVVVAVVGGIYFSVRRHLDPQWGRMNEGNGWNNADSVGREASMAALNEWKANGGRYRVVRGFRPPLPLGLGMDPEALADWVLDEAVARNDMSRAQHMSGVKRDRLGNIIGDYDSPALEPVARRRTNRALWDGVCGTGSTWAHLSAHPGNALLDADEMKRLGSDIEALRPQVDHMRTDRLRECLDGLGARIEVLREQAGLPSQPVAVEAGTPATSERQRRADAVARIEAVWDDHARRRLDIVEVIEHHALFSMRFAPTAAFEEFSLRVRETDLDALGDADLLEMSAHLDTLYRTAVENAEHLGFEALRDPKTGSTAVKLARTAADTRTPEGERLNARTKLEGALGELGLTVGPRMLDAICPRELMTQEKP